MPELSRPQLIVYAALAAAVLFLGARWIGTSDPPEAGGVAVASGAASEPDGTGATLKTSRGELVVHVAGEVKRPGVYRMPAGARVADVLERAGGATGVALPDAINLAAKLADGQQVVVPRSGPGGAAAPAASADDPATDGPISLGTATAEQLEAIEGIGPVTAQNIIDFRDQRGGLGSIEDLDQIPGIGPATMEALRARLQP